MMVEIFRFRYMAPAFLAPLLVLLVGFFSYRSWADFSQTSAEAAKSRRVVESVETVVMAVREAEFDVRSYILTGDSGSFAAAERDMPRVRAAEAQLKQVAADTEDQARRIENLSNILDREIAVLPRLLIERRDRGLQAALQMVVAEQRSGAFSRVSQIAQEINEIGAGRRSAYAANARASVTRLGLIATIGSFLLLVLLAIAAFALRRGSQRQWELLVQSLRSEQEASAARDWLQAILANTSDGIIATDPLGRVVFINSVAKRLTAWNQQDAAGQMLEAVFPVVDSRLLSREGQSTPIAWNKAEIRDDSGALIGHVVNFRDTTAEEEARVRDAFLLASLQESEARYRITVASAAVGIAEVDLQGRFLHFNDALCNILGYGPEELQDRDAYDVTHPDDVAASQELSTRLLTGASPSASIEKRYIRKDGSVVWASVTVSVARNAASDPVNFVSVIQDISARKQVEEALRDNRERLQLAQSATGIGIWDWNLVSGAIAWSPEVFHLYGFPEDTTPALELWERSVHPEDKERVLRELAAVVGSGPNLDTEFRIRRVDGAQVWILCRAKLIRDDLGNPIRLLGVNVDISSRKQVEASIRESEQRFRELAEFMPQIVWVLRPDGVCDYANRRWSELTGMNLVNFRNGSLARVMPAEDFERLLASAKPNEQAAWSLECRFRRAADGSLRWHLLRAFPVIGEQGEIVKWLGTATDIDEQKRTEDQLRRANDDLRQFAFAASHDLQEPLRMITAFSQLLVKTHRGNFDERAEQLVEYISGGTSRMSKLLADLLDYTQVNYSEVTRERVNLSEVCSEAISNLRSLIDESGAVVCYEPLPIVSGQASLFLQLFQNLIANAIRYRSGEPPRVHVSVRQGQSEWTIGVSDNGIGIPEAYHDLIFGVFKRLHAGSVPGTGIGLAICKRVVERFGGRIWVESQPGEGATFFFTLPRMDLTEVQS